MYLKQQLYSLPILQNRCPCHLLDIRLLVCMFHLFSLFLKVEMMSLTVYIMVLNY